VWASDAEDSHQPARRERAFAILDPTLREANVENDKVAKLGGAMLRAREKDKSSSMRMTASSELRASRTRELERKLGERLAQRTTREREVGAMSTSHYAQARRIGSDGPELGWAASGGVSSASLDLSAFHRPRTLR
jgi:hypothetical protein